MIDFMGSNSQGGLEAKPGQTRPAMSLTRGSQMLLLILSKPQKSELCVPGDLVSLSQDREVGTLALSSARGACGHLLTPSLHTARQEWMTLGRREKRKEKKVAARGGPCGSSEDHTPSHPQLRTCLLRTG